MKCTIVPINVIRVPLLLQLQTSTHKSHSSSTFIDSTFCSRRLVSHPIYKSIINMTTTSRQTRSMQSKSGDATDGAKIPVKKKSKAVKTVAVNDKTKVTTEAIQKVPVKVETSASKTLVDGKPWYTFFTKGDVVYDAYMANEWGYEKHGDQALFEKLSLEGAQAGLTWRTILHKREAYRTTFYHFEAEKVVTMTKSDIERIMNETPSDPKNTRSVIVRNRAKVESVIHNAKLVLQMKEECYNNSTNSSTSPTSDAFSHYLWSFVDHKPILNVRTFGNATSTSIESERMSKALKKLGFKFVGPTTCYSLMQAVGMVIDHPHDTPEWNLAYQRLLQRPGGYQDRKS